MIRLKALVWGWFGITALAVLLPQVAGAHCDTLDGPVIKQARFALDKGDVTPVLKWVAPAREQEIKTAFNQAVEMRTRQPAQKESADLRFFETLVRVHRAGEGASFSGLKVAGEGLTPALKAADQALETGSAEPLLKLVDPKFAAGVRQRFSTALERKKTAEESVKAGRAYVAAYVDYVHYVESIEAGKTTEHSAEHQHEH